MPSLASPTLNCVVIGASYVGGMVSRELIQTLPSTHRVVVLEKNSHFQHLFAYPRFAVSPGSEHKAFIPFQPVEPHLILRAAATSVSATAIQLDRSVSIDGKDVTEILYDALVIATGTRLAAPGNMPGETKREGVEYLQRHQKQVRDAQKIVLLGGGAVGIQMATDIKILYPSKEVVLVHSREQVMPRFHPKLSEIVLEKLGEIGVETVLGSRARIPESGVVEGVKELHLEDGRVIAADLIIMANGQTPLSDFLKSVAPSAVRADGYIAVKPTLQIEGQDPALDQVFALGDVAASGGPKAARPGAVQAKVVAANIVKLISKDRGPLEIYRSEPAGIHMSLGIVPSIVFRNPPCDASSGKFDGEPPFFMKDDGQLDMGVEGVWARRAPGVTDYHL